MNVYQIDKNECQTIQNFKENVNGKNVALIPCRQDCKLVQACGTA